MQAVPIYLNPVKVCAMTVDVMEILRRYKKQILLLIGVPTVLDVAKEFLRSKAEDYLVAHLGWAGQWLIGNPFSLLTISVIGCLLWLAWTVMKPIVTDKHSIILDSTHKPYTHSKKVTQWNVVFAVVVVIVATLVSFGAYRYYILSHAIAKQQTVAVNNSPSQNAKVGGASIQGVQTASQTQLRAATKRTALTPDRSKTAAEITKPASRVDSSGNVQRGPLPQQEANPSSISGTYGGVQIIGAVVHDSGIAYRTGGSSLSVPEKCDMSGAVNYCNSPNSEISNVTVRSANPAVNVTNSENTPTSGIDYQQTPPLGGDGPGGPTIDIHGAIGTHISGNVDEGCGSQVAAINAPGTMVENSEAHIMPPDACELYYGALNLEVGCGGKKDQLIAWEKRVATFFTGENLKQWNEKFGPYNPVAIEAMTLEQMCKDVFYDSPKMHFFQRVYYGHEGYPVN